MRDTFFVTNQDNNERSNCEKNIFNLTNREINLIRYSFLEEILYYLYHPRYTFYYCKRKIGLKIGDLKELERLKKQLNADLEAHGESLDQSRRAERERLLRKLELKKMQLQKKKEGGMIPCSIS